MKFLCLPIFVLALVLGACERHTWEDQKDEDGHVTQKGTKRLYEGHGEHGGAHEEHGGDQEGHGEGEGATENKGQDEAAGGGHDHDGDGKADH